MENFDSSAGTNGARWSRSRKALFASSILSAILAGAFALVQTHCGRYLIGAERITIVNASPDPIHGIHLKYIDGPDDTGEFPQGPTHNAPWGDLASGERESSLWTYDRLWIFEIAYRADDKEWSVPVQAELRPGDEVLLVILGEREVDFRANNGSPARRLTGWANE